MFRIFLKTLYVSDSFLNQKYAFALLNGVLLFRSWHISCKCHNCLRKFSQFILSNCLVLLEPIGLFSTVSYLL